jgi:hypothetical protein
MTANESSVQDDKEYAELEGSHSKKKLKVKRNEEVSQYDDYFIKFG